MVKKSKWNGFGIWCFAYLDITDQEIFVIVIYVPIYLESLGYASATPTDCNANIPVHFLQKPNDPTLFLEDHTGALWHIRPCQNELNVFLNNTLVTS